MPKQLHSHILECQRRAMEQFHQMMVAVNISNRGNIAAFKAFVGPGDNFFKLGFIQRPGNKWPEYFKGQFIV